VSEQQGHWRGLCVDFSCFAGHAAGMGGQRGAYRILVGRNEGRRPLGRPRRRWGSIKIGLEEVGWGTWTELSWLRIGTDGGLL
jgi:hypothetical protein